MLGKETRFEKIEARKNELLQIRTADPRLKRALLYLLS